MNRFFLTLLVLLASLRMMSAGWHDVPLQSQITHVQPMTGLVLWEDLAHRLYTTYGQSHAMEFAYLPPCRVVPGCDDDGTVHYDWSYLETLLDDIKGRSHQAVLRFFYEYPGETMVDGNEGTTAVPAYIKARSDYHETFSHTGDGACYYADWSNAELKRFTKQFYADFAARYASDPRIAFIEVGFGHWSEYHIYDGSNTNIQLGKNFPTKEYQKEFFLHLASVMPIPWAISIDAASTKYAPFRSDAELRALRFGLFDDSFMHLNHELSSGDGYNEQCWLNMGFEEHWQTGVCGGEVSYYTKNDQPGFTNPAGMYGHTWEEQAAKYHITFMIANNNPGGKNDYNNPSRFKECSMASGYHFEVTRCQTDGVQTCLTVTNKGVAPLYRDAYFAIGMVRSGESLRGLLPGESLEVTIPASLSSAADGTLLHKPVIVSDYILDTQQIEYDCRLTTTSVSSLSVPASSSLSSRSSYNLRGQSVPRSTRDIVIIRGCKFVNK